MGGGERLAGRRRRREPSLDCEVGLMNDMHRNARCDLMVVIALALALPVLPLGCAEARYRELRLDGQQMMLAGQYGPAQYSFEQAGTFKPRRLENLHDLGACSVMIARERFAEINPPAAMRELDKAIAYYSQAIEVFPGYQPAIEGKNVALKLKGQFEEALRHAEWAAEFVGPSARQYLFLAKELEERGDVDGALLRYRQAVATEPYKPEAHIAFAQFLFRFNDEESAVYHLQMAYHLDPKNPWVVEQLASHGGLPPLASSVK